jgi:hypothetical protein
VHGGRLVPGSRCGCFLSRSATIFWYFLLAFSFPAKAEGTISNEGRFGTPEPILGQHPETTRVRLTRPDPGAPLFSVSVVDLFGRLDFSPRTPAASSLPKSTKRMTRTPSFSPPNSKARSSAQRVRSTFLDTEKMQVVRNRRQHDRLRHDVAVKERIDASRCSTEECQNVQGAPSPHPKVAPDVVRNCLACAGAELGWYAGGEHGAC